MSSSSAIRTVTCQPILKPTAQRIPAADGASLPMRKILARDKTSLDITWIKSDSGTEDYTLAKLLEQIKEKSANIAKAVAALEELIGEVDE